MLTNSSNSKVPHGLQRGVLGGFLFSGLKNTEGKKGFPR